MVSYEQSWRDSHSTLALKNNTKEEIKNVVFLMTYLDMDGHELDYEEFSINVNIAPGMTRKVDIEAYERERNYHYYLSDGLYDNTSFKVKFQLKDYNRETINIEETDNHRSIRHDLNRNNSRNEFFPTIMLLITLLFVLGIVVGSYVLVAVMAQKRNRNVVIWVLLSLMATPLLMIIILLCIGKNERDYFDQ